MPKNRSFSVRQVILLEALNQQTSYVPLAILLIYPFDPKSAMTFPCSTKLGGAICRNPFAED